MQSLRHEIATGQAFLNVEESIRRVGQLKAALLEIQIASGSDENSISEAKALWNAAVTASVQDTGIDREKSRLIALCRELAFVVLQQHLHRPWDDQTLLHFSEMSVRLARAFNGLEDNGKARLYLSKAAEVRDMFKDEVDVLDVIAPTLHDQFHNVLCLYFVEKIRTALDNTSGIQIQPDLLIDEALKNIKANYLPHFVGDLVSVFCRKKSTCLIPCLEKVYSAIRPIESFPAHISDDLIYLLVDLCISQGQKARLEMAGGLLEQVSLQTASFHQAKMKFLLSVGAKDDDIAKCFLSCAQSGSSVLGMSQMIREAGSLDLLLKCVQALKEVDLRSFNGTTQSELVELNCTLFLQDEQISMMQGLNYLLEHLSFLNDSSRNRLQQILVEKSEFYRTKNDLHEAYELIKVCQSLLSDASELDKRNAPIVQRMLVQCLLDLGRFDEAEEAVLGLACDLHGLTLRFILSLALKNKVDSIRNLDLITRQPNVTLNHILSLGNRCKAADENEVLLRVLAAAINRFEKERAPVTLQAQILVAAAYTASQKLPESCIEEKSRLILGFMEKDLTLLVSDAEIDSPDVFFRITWNAGVAAAKAHLYVSGALLFYTAYKMLHSGRWKTTVKLNNLKISCIEACLSNFCQVLTDEYAVSLAPLTCERNGMMKEAKELLDDVEISSIYLPTPTSKRPKLQEALQLEVEISFDHVKMIRSIEALEYKLAVLDGDEIRCVEALRRLGISGTREVFERLLAWCVPVKERVQPRSIIGLLELLAKKIIEGDGKGSMDLAKFAILYRGMAIIALAQDASGTNVDGAAFQYYKQALDIIKLYNGEYPVSEVCWLAVSSYNHAIRISALTPEKARSWCELSLALLHHTGEYRETYEPAIRTGYSKILERLV